MSCNRAKHSLWVDGRFYIINNGEYMGRDLLHIPHSLTYNLIEDGLATLWVHFRERYRIQIV
jgi:hypothetical protein